MLEALELWKTAFLYGRQVGIILTQISLAISRNLFFWGSAIENLKCWSSVGTLPLIISVTTTIKFSLHYTHVTHMKMIVWVRRVQIHCQIWSLIFYSSTFGGKFKIRTSVIFSCIWFLLYYGVVHHVGDIGGIRDFERIVLDTDNVKTSIIYPQKDRFT